MKKKPLFSVIIPAYNHEKYISDCVQSVLNQTCQDFELIIINDGSSDKTGEIVESFSDERIKYFYQENHDAPYTINRGMREAKGEYIAILNSDDIFECNKLAESLVVLSEGCEFTFGKLVVIDENNKPFNGEEPRVKWINDKLNNFEQGNLLKWLLCNINFLVTTSNFVFKKSILDEVGFFHEKLHYSHDFDFLLRAIMAQKSIKFIPKVLSKYRMHSDNTILKGRAEAILEASYAITKLIDNHQFPSDTINDGFYKVSEFSNTISFLLMLTKEEREQVINDKGNANRVAILDVINNWLRRDADFEKMTKEIIEKNSRIAILEAELSLLGDQLSLVTSSKFWKIRNAYLKLKYLSSSLKKNKKNVVTDTFKLGDNKTENSLVSVVIPCYNYGKFIEEAIDSVLASTYQNIEIIVVDDGPTDPFTIELLKNLSKSKTRVIFQENQGLARARNNGISQANGEFILPLDADDKIDPTYIEKALYVLKQRPQLGLAYGYAQVFGSQYFLWETGKYNIEKLTRENIIPSCSLFRKSVWEKVGGYENDRYQYDDWTFWLKLASHGYYGQLIPEVLFFHRKHPGQANMTDRLSEKHEEYYDKIKEKFPELFKKKSEFRRRLKKAEALASRCVILKRVTRFIAKRKECFTRIVPREKFEIVLGIDNRSSSNKANKLLIFLPWTIRGGAEKVTLDVIKNLTNWEIFIVTTVENKYDSAVDLDFKNIAKHVYHLPNFLSKEDYLHFVEGLISMNDIKTVLINHCAWAYENSENIKGKFNDLNIFDLLHNTMDGGYKDWSFKYGQWITKTIVISDELQTHLLDKMGFLDKKVTCIPNGVDVDGAFNPGNSNISEIEREFSFPKNKKGIAFIGRLSPEKNPLKFVEVARAVSKAFPDDYFFIMVGGGDLMEAVAKEVSSCFNKQEFFILDNYSYPEKVLAVSSFLINTSSIEGMPLTILEALSMEVPAIAPSIGAMSEIITDGFNGWILSENPSVEEYVKAIENSRDESVYLKLRSNGRASVVDRFASGDMAKKYQEVFLNK